MSDILTGRRITEENHQQFADLSGDLNPLHVDREASKAMPPGQRLAYGMDMLLWALEILESHNKLPAQFARVRVRFTKWVFLEDEVELRGTQDARPNLYELVVDDAAVAAFELLTGEPKAGSLPDCAAAPASRRVLPNALLLQQLVNHEGLAPLADGVRAAAMFPSLAKRFGRQWLRECASCSYVIGMEAPGLYSMSMRYDLHFRTEPQESGCLHFKVIAVDERFRKIRIAVEGSAISATLEAMVRET